MRVAILFVICFCFISPASALNESQAKIVGFFLCDDEYTQKAGHPLAREILSICHPLAAFKKSSVRVYRDNDIDFKIDWDGFGMSKNNKTIIRFEVDDQYVLRSISIVHDDSPFKGFHSLKLLKDLLHEMVKTEQDKKDKSPANEKTLIDKLAEEINRKIEYMSGKELFEYIMKLRWHMVEMPKVLKEYAS